MKITSKILKEDIINGKLENFLLKYNDNIAMGIVDFYSNKYDVEVMSETDDAVNKCRKLIKEKILIPFNRSGNLFVSDIDILKIKTSSPLYNDVLSCLYTNDID